MKHLLKHSYILLFLFTVSPVVFGHVAIEHTFTLSSGLLHMLIDPVHVFPIIMVVLLLFMMRKQLACLLEWIISNIFR